MSLRKRVSISCRGAWPGQKRGTCAVGINSVNSLSKYRSMSSRETVTVTWRSQVLRSSTATSNDSLGVYNSDSATAASTPVSSDSGRIDLVVFVVWHDLAAEK